MSEVAILAYGSLINDPGAEISPLIVNRISAETPFPVEYARLSETRGGAPTVVPHSSGVRVKAQVLVLSDSVSLEEAKNLLWRRETSNEGSGLAYRESLSGNGVVVRPISGFCGLDHVLYTDFHPSGKLSSPNGKELARAALDSVMKAPDGKDGVSYLMDLVSSGVITALTPSYREEILALTSSSDLAEAIEVVRAGTQGDRSR